MAKAFQYNILFFVSFFSAFTVVGQELNKHFEIRESKGVDKLDLRISTKTGRSFLNAVDADAPMVILGASENDVAASTFKIERDGQVQQVDAQLLSKNQLGLNFTEAIAGSFFSSSSQFVDTWKINLSEHLIFRLSLDYLMGNADIDLSRLTVDRLKINSASADVNVGFSDPIMNGVVMDTFFVKVNFGNILVTDLNYAMAKEIIAEVGFGSISLDCGNSWNLNSKINAYVGAGSLNIALPADDIPVIIRINSSPLCNIKMAKNFEKIGHNVFGNQAYIDNPDEGMEFFLDVGMGSIVFTSR